MTAAAAGQYNDAVTKRSLNLVQFQLFAMYFEGACSEKSQGFPSRNDGFKVLYIFD